MCGCAASNRVGSEGAGTRQQSPPSTRNGLRGHGRGAGGARAHRGAQEGREGVAVLLGTQKGHGGALRCGEPSGSVRGSVDLGGTRRGRRGCSW